MAESPFNIFVGTSEAGGFLYNLAEGLRELGHVVTTGIGWGLTHYEYEYDLALDLDEPVNWVEVEDRLRGQGAPPPEEITDASSTQDRVLWVLANHDLFVFLFTSLWPDEPGPPFGWGIGREFELLRALGKKIVVMFTGYEARHARLYDQFTAWAGVPTEPFCTTYPASARASLDRVVRNLRRAELYADLILSLPGMAGLAIRPYMHLFAPADVRSIRPRYPDREIPRVVHAPSHLLTKGTPPLIEALATLESSGGSPYQLHLVQRVPHAQLMRLFRDADVVVDQVLFCHGVTGVEAMAAGAALACFDHPALAPYPEKRPIWRLDVKNLVDQLQRLLCDRALRTRLAREGRRYAVLHHDRRAVAAAILDRMAAGSEAVMEHHPEFFARHAEIPEGLGYSEASRALTERVIDRWGLPQGVAWAELAARGWVGSRR